MKPFLFRLVGFDKIYSATMAEILCFVKKDKVLIYRVLAR